MVGLEGDADGAAASIWAAVGCVALPGERSARFGQPDRKSRVVISRAIVGIVVIFGDLIGFASLIRLNCAVQSRWLAAPAPPDRLTPRGSRHGPSPPGQIPTELS